MSRRVTNRALESVAHVARADASARSRDYEQIAIRGALLLVVVKVALLITYGLHTRYIMDEYVHASLSRDIAHFYRDHDPVKTILFTVIFLPALALANDTVEFMRLARVETVAFGIGVICLIYSTALRLTGSKLDAILAACTLVSFSNFIERIFEVRSDPLAAFFAVLALWVSCKEDRLLLRAALAGVLLGCGFLCTQKAAYFVLAQAVGHLAMAKRGSLRETAKCWGVSAAGFLVAFLVYSVCFGGLDFFRVASMVLLSPMKIVRTGHDHYADLHRFLRQTIERNPFQYALCLAGLGFGAFSAKTRQQALAAAFTAVITLLMLFHPQPWPYVYIFCLPFLALWAGPAIRALAGETRQAQLALFVVGVCTLSLVRNSQFLTLSSADQDEVVRQTERFLGPDEVYGDGVGMIATRHQAQRTWWDAPNISVLREELARGDTSSLDEIFAEQPKLWIGNYRFFNLRQELGPYIAQSYVRVMSNLYLTGVRIEPGKQVPFRNHWAGAYRLFDESGNPISEKVYLDGMEADTPVLLERGVVRRISAPFATIPLYLLPADSKFEAPLAPLPEPIDLFVGIYDF